MLPTLSEIFSLLAGFTVSPLKAVIKSIPYANAFCASNIRYLARTSGWSEWKMTSMPALERIMGAYTLPSYPSSLLAQKKSVQVATAMFSLAMTSAILYASSAWWNVFMVKLNSLLSLIIVVIFFKWKMN